MIHNWWLISSSEFITCVDFGVCIACHFRRQIVHCYKCLTIFFPFYLCGRHSKAIEAHSLKRVFSHLLHADWIQQANQRKGRVKGILCERPCTYKNHSRILHSETTKGRPLFSVSWNCFVSLWAGINTFNVNATQTWLCDSSYSVKPPFSTGLGQRASIRGLKPLIIPLNTIHSVWFTHWTLEGLFSCK